LCIPLHKRIVEKVPKELLEALTHTTWYRHVGPTKIRYFLAILIIEGILEEEATSTKIAQLVGVNPPSVARPLKDLREAKLVHQDKARGPYQLSEKIAEDLYRLRSAKGEFGRDELAKRKAQEQRRFYEYQRKLKDTVLHFMQDGSDPYHALKLAKDLSIPPRGIDGYELNKRQEWALNWAKREYASETSQGDNQYLGSVTIGAGDGPDPASPTDGRPARGRSFPSSPTASLDPGPVSN
jgi:Mn-dependent DtxR family transcriptional regulator